MSKKFLSSYLYVNYPENETLPLGDPVPPKAKSILDVWVWVMSTKILVKYFGPLACVWCVVVLGQSILTWTYSSHIIFIK
jgi:hypothetical protein